MKIDFNKFNIEYYFSFNNPYSYLAWVSLRKIMRKSSSGLIPFELSAANKDRQSTYMDYWNDSRWKNISDLGNEIEVIIKPPKENKQGIDNLIRAINKSNEQLLERFITSVFKANFEASIDISNDESLFSFLSNDGFSSQEIDKLFSDHSDNKEKISMDSLSKWESEKIRMLPTIKIGEERFIGYSNNRNFIKILSPLID